MNMAIVVRRLSGHGGMESVIATVNKAARSYGTPLEVWAMGHPDDSSWLRDTLCRQVNIDQGTARRLQLHAKLPLYVGELAFLLRTTSVDTLLATDPTFVEAAFWARKLVRRPLRIISWLHFPLDRMAHIRHLLHADGHLAISTGLQRQLRAMGVRAPITVTYNPLPADFHPQDPPPSPEPGHFLYVGRLAVAQKRIDLILYGLQHLPGPWQLTLVGDGPDRSLLESLAAELGLSGRVHFAGWRADPWERQSPTALLLPSDFEGFPMALVEALARGIPVIAADCATGPSDIIYEGKNGFLISPGSAKGLRCAAQRSLHPRAWRWDAGHRQRDALRRFNAKRVFQAMTAGIEACRPR